MLHPAAALRLVNETIGMGVFATAFIPKGTIIWILDELDIILSPREVAALPALLRPIVETWSYVDGDGCYVFCWDHGRYMNHSCEPSSRGIGECIEIAVRDIHPGEQLTCEYGTLRLSRPLECACGAAACRGQVTPADVAACWAAWDVEASEAAQLAASLPQPLIPFARRGNPEQAILDAISGGRPLPPLPSSRAFQSLQPSAPVPAGAALWALSEVSA